MRIHRSDSQPPERPATPPVESKPAAAGQPASAGQPAAAGQPASAGQPAAAAQAPEGAVKRRVTAELPGYGVVTSISEEARAAAEKSRKEWRPSIRYIFEQGLDFAHQAVDRRRLARVVRQQVESEAVGQANRLAAMDAGNAHPVAAKAGEELRRARPDLVA